MIAATSVGPLSSVSPPRSQALNGGPGGITMKTRPEKRPMRWLRSSCLILALPCWRAHRTKPGVIACATKRAQSVLVHETPQLPSSFSDMKELSPPFIEREGASCQAHLSRTVARQTQRPPTSNFSLCNSALRHRTRQILHTVLVVMSSNRPPVPRRSSTVTSLSSLVRESMSGSIPSLSVESASGDYTLYVHVDRAVASSLPSRLSSYLFHCLRSAGTVEIMHLGFDGAGFATADDIIDANTEDGA
jgi:hypothetical protein